MASLTWNITAVRKLSQFWILIQGNLDAVEDFETQEAIEIIEALDAIEAIEISEAIEIIDALEKNERLITSSTGSD